MDAERNYASKGVAGTALGLGIGALGVEVLRGGLNGILSGNPAPAAAPAAAAGGNDVLIAAMMAAASKGSCNEDHTVNRYEASQAARIAELETEVKLRDANTYTDQKLLEVYKYFDNKISGVEAQLCQQAVYNATNTAALNCMQGQIAQLQSLTKMVIPNSSVCPGWGAATVTVSTGTTTT